jgi:hypothetical protein
VRLAESGMQSSVQHIPWPNGRICGELGCRKAPEHRVHELVFDARCLTTRLFCSVDAFCEESFREEYTLSRALLFV